MLSRDFGDIIFFFIGTYVGYVRKEIYSVGNSNLSRE